MSVNYAILFLLVFISIALGLDDEGCDTPQYLNLGETDSIKCVFKEGYYGVFWYGSTDTVRGEPILEYVESAKGGTGYSSREFDIHPNGSLIINDVSLAHDREFAVLKFQSKTEDPLRFVIKVIATARPSPPYPVIGECGNISLPCFVEFNQPSKLSCFVRQARPRINVRWVAYTANGDLNVSSEAFVTNDSVKYTSRVETTESFFNKTLLTLLVCRADSLPSMLTTDETFILVHNVNRDFSFSSPRPLTQFVEHTSRFQLSCSEHDFLFLVWKRKSLSDDTSTTLLYSILGEVGFTKLLLDDFETNDKGSLIFPRVGVHHEGLYSCIYGNGLTDGYQLYNLVVYVTPAIQYPIVDGCDQQQRCVKEVTRKGNLTCSVSGIRPEVQLEWVTVSGGSSDITFTNQQTRTNSNRDTFDITTTIEFYIKSAPPNRLTVKCHISGQNSAIFLQATTVDLLILPDEKEPTDVPLADGRTNTWILAVVIPVILVISMISVYYRYRKRNTKFIPTGEEVPMMSSDQHTFDMTAKRNIFTSQLRGKYEDLCNSIRPIPYIVNKLHCVNNIFVEGGIRVFNTNDRRGKFEQLDSYKDILNNKRIQSPRYILEGEPGVGKSTFSLQLAYDWCNGEAICSNKTIELLILLRLRQLGGVESIYRAIKQFLLPKDSNLTESDIKSLVENSESCVIILDGYDEYPEQNSETDSDINNIINRKMLQQSKVILTTRVECLPKKFAPITKCLRLTGFDDKARELYIKKVFLDDGNDTVKDIEKRLKENPFLADLCEVPLFFAMFVHVCHDFESAEKFKTVTSFFRHIVSCFHSHMKNKMNDENVERFELFETEHHELDKLAYESLNKKHQEIVWDKEKMCNRIGHDFYEQYKLIGMLVEENVLHIVDKPGTIISKHVQTTTQVRFYHSLFCEWYAAHFLVQYAEKPEVTFDPRDGVNGCTGPVRNEINLDYLDPFNHQYVFRFACGLSPVAADKIFQYFKSRYGGDRFETLCILEQTGVFENIKSEIVDLCSSPVAVQESHSKLQQRSTIQLLEIASSKQIPIVQLRLENCFSLVDCSKRELQLISGVNLSILHTLKELHIETSSTKINSKDANEILWYSSVCGSLEKLKFVDCLPPQVIDVDSLDGLRSRNVRVSWDTYFSTVYNLNLQSGLWQHEDGKVLTDDEYKDEANRVPAI